MGTGTKAAVVAIVVILVGLAGYELSGPVEAPVQAAKTEAPQAEEPQVAEPAVAPEPTVEPTAPASEPAKGGVFDIVRISPAGEVVVAGQVTGPAAGGARVSIQLDGTAVGKADADGAGNFTALFAIAPGAAGRIMTMTAERSDGTSGEIGGQVAIAEVKAPEVASAELSAPETPVAVADTSGTVAEPEAAAPAAVAVTEEGAKVLQSEAPALVGNVTLETITYPSEDLVQFGGHGTPGDRVQLYLDGAALGAPAAIGKDGAWNLGATGIAPKVYKLRVDQIDATGKVVSRYETPFKRETVEALAAAAETAPAAGSAPEAPSASDPATEEPSSQSAETTPAATEPAVQSAAPAPVSVTVQPGFTLWGIAKRELGSGYRYVQVFEANKDKIRDPNLIYPGQVFLLPKE
jgi:nucleoid-associated protein YgaU